MNPDGQILRFGKALLRTVRDQALTIISTLLNPVIENALQVAINPTTRFLTKNLISKIAEDGAILEGPVPSNAYAKYAIRKGLPEPGERTLAIENEPHRVDDFSGEILSGYGKGTKTLLSSEIVPVKIKDRTFLGRMNYHAHQADRAGLHYDLVVEGVPPKTKNWEIHIPRGPFRGRYAFVATPRGTLIVPMKDEGVQLPKPNYILKDKSFLATLDPKEWIVEQKYDGSLANVYINSNARASFRSHRDGGNTYYDRLPNLEFLSNKSRLFLYRKLFPAPNLADTILKGEVVHPDGSARVGGILNAYPDKANQVQDERGCTTFWAWDIAKLKGKDVSKLPESERRALLEKVIDQIREFNTDWYIARKAENGQSFEDFYEKVTQEVLPWGEGIVVKRGSDPSGQIWYKVKQTDFVDLPVVGFIQGEPGKYQDTLGALIVENPENGARGEVGSLSITDEQRNWIWQNREHLIGTYAKIRAQAMTDRGVPRAGVFYEFHEGKGNEAGLRMYAESLAGGNQEETQETIYKLKSAAGWRK